MTMTSSKFHTRLFASFVLAASFASGCVSVDAEVPEVSVVQKDFTFPALPIQVTGEHTVEQQFTFAHGPIEMPEGFSSNLRTIGVQLVVNRGIEDFSFIRNLHIKLSDGKNPTLDIARFERNGDNDTSSNVLELEPLTSGDTLKMWQTDAVTFDLSLTGSLPHEEWSMDVVVRFAGEFGYDL